MCVIGSWYFVVFGGIVVFGFTYKLLCADIVSGNLYYLLHMRIGQP